MATDHDQAAGERAVFGEFASVAGFRVRIDTIESRPSPEPDIRCEVEGDGLVAFELGQVVNEALERMTSESSAARRQFRALYEALPAPERAAVEVCLGGPPAVFAGFARGVQPGRWRRAVRPILDTLIDRARAARSVDRLREGDIPVWQIPALSDVLSALTVRRSSGRPFLGALEMTEVVDATWRLLEKKFGRSYQTALPIELLAYYVAAPPPDTPAWRSEVREYLRAHRPGSPFRRVWLFNGFTNAIVLVDPPHAG